VHEAQSEFRSAVTSEVGFDETWNERYAVGGYGSIVQVSFIEQYGELAFELRHLFAVVK
jgi:hypothetical protein